MIEGCHSKAPPPAISPSLPPFHKAHYHVFGIFSFGGTARKDSLQEGEQEYPNEVQLILSPARWDLVYLMAEGLERGAGPSLGGSRGGNQRSRQQKLTSQDKSSFLNHIATPLSCNEEYSAQLEGKRKKAGAFGVWR